MLPSPMQLQEPNLRKSATVPEQLAFLPASGTSLSSFAPFNEPLDVHAKLNLQFPFGAFGYPLGIPKTNLSYCK